MEVHGGDWGVTLPPSAFQNFVFLVRKIEKTVFLGVF
jgi:hypothetical protein